MAELRVFLRYGIVGYMVLFFDLLFISALVGPDTMLTLLKESSVGAIVLALGLPVGWVCYQIWDWVVHKYVYPKEFFPQMLMKWEKKTIGTLLPFGATTVIGNNVTRPDNKNISEHHINQYGIYCENFHSRGVISLSFIMTYISFVVIDCYYILQFVISNPDLKLSDSYDYWPSLLLSLLLPIAVSAIAYMQFRRVERDTDMYGWCLLREKEPEAIELIKALAQELPDKYFQEAEKERKKKLEMIKENPKKFDNDTKKNSLIEMMKIIQQNNINQQKLVSNNKEVDVKSEEYRAIRILTEVGYIERNPVKVEKNEVEKGKKVFLYSVTEEGKKRLEKETKVP